MDKNDKNIKVNAPDSSYVFDITGSIHDASVMRTLALHHTYEPHIYHLFKEIVKPDHICFDIGANIGVTSVYLSKMIGENGKLYAFEPSKRNYSFLQKNISQNYLENTEPINLGIYDEDTSAEFSYVEGAAACSFISVGEIKEGEEEQIQCVKLDDWVEKNKIKALDFIKLDVEGCEEKALKGARETITKFKPDLVIEFNPTTIIKFFSAKPEDLFSLLNSIFPFIYVIDKQINGKLSLVESYKDLEDFNISSDDYFDLYCTFRMRSIAKSFVSRIKSNFKKFIQK